MINRVKFNRDCLQRYLTNHSISDFDMNRLSNTKNTFEFDDEYTLKVIARGSTKEKYYNELSCSDYLESIENPVLFVQSKNDPICR